MASLGAAGAAQPDAGPDPEEAVGLLLRDLRATADGLSSAEAQRRLLQYGPNELQRRRGPRWPAELAAQLTHPLALLLWAAAGLSFVAGNLTVRRTRFTGHLIEQIDHRI